MLYHIITIVKLNLPIYSIKFDDEIMMINISLHVMFNKMSRLFPSRWDYYLSPPGSDTRTSLFILKNDPDPIRESILCPYVF